MAITSIKVHPAIGGARLCNSPDEFFIGPERLWDPPDPPGGFKDAHCRVKRQAARFRVSAYHDDHTMTELTAADAEITWSVDLANKKAVKRNAGFVGSLTIDPGAKRGAARSGFISLLVILGTDQCHKLHVPDTDIRLRTPNCCRAHDEPFIPRRSLGPRMYR